MRIKGETYFLLIITAATLLAMGLSLKLEASSKLLPELIGGVTLFLTVMQFWADFRAGKTPKESTTTATTSGGAKHRAYLIAISWSAGFLLCIYLFGFLAAIAALVLVYMKAHGTRWLTSIIFAVISVVAYYGLFQVVMKVDLFPGVITSLLLP